MKIASKFLSSSISLCTMIVLLIGGTNFWARFQEAQFEIKREDIQLRLEKLIELQFLLDQQVNSLKDFLVLNRDAKKMIAYQKSRSNFLISLQELEQDFPNNQALVLLNKRYQNLQKITDNLTDVDEGSAILQQDILSINSFQRDIILHLNSLKDDVQIQSKSIKKEEKYIGELLNYTVLILIILIVLLMFIQYRLVINPVIKSLNHLTLGVQRVSTGDFQYRLNFTGEDEIAKVAQNFNQMTDVLEELYEDLEKKVDERTEQLKEINIDLNSEILKREVIQEELRDIFEETKRSQQLLLGIINATPDWIFVKDLDFKFILVNKSFAKHFNLKPQEIIGKSLTDFNILSDALSANKTKSFELIEEEDRFIIAGKNIHNPSDYVVDFNGITHILDTQKTPLFDDKHQVIGILGISRDVTSRHLAQEALEKSESELRHKATELQKTLQQLKQTQSQIIQSEKMSSLGQMVAGVAHEINNPVNFIFGNIVHAKEYVNDLISLIEIYQEEYPVPTERVQEEIETIELDYLLDDIPKLLNSMTVGAERIRDIVKSLRTFSRLDESEMKTVNVHDGIDSTLMILHNRIKEKQGHAQIEVIKHYGDLPEIDCYAGQLNQVFMNILSNAIDALDEYDASREKDELEQQPSQITITTEKLASIPGMTEWIAIRIKDNGSGIPEDIRSKLFEPFFTTKDVGKGTGLGLSISHSIVVDKHGGCLSCYSQVDQGTEFTIEIPITAPTVTVKE